MSDSGFTFYFGAASGSARKALRQLEEPNVMLNYATQNNQPWSGIDRLFIDSGGYSFMKGKGEYTTTDVEYLDFIEKHQPEIWALRDYPCEPDVLSEHGRDVREHQRRTTQRHVSLVSKLEGRNIEGRPVSVLQGWDVDDYLRHIDELREHDVLTQYVGIGSVCRRHQSEQIKRIILSVADELPPQCELHAFGVKGSALEYPRVRAALSSADSQSFDFRARYTVLKNLGPGQRGWRDVALAYLEQRQQIRRLLAGGGDTETDQQTLVEACADGGGR
jgi:hypothetical protein